MSPNILKTALTTTARRLAAPALLVCLAGSLAGCGGGGGSVMPQKPAPAPALATTTLTGTLLGIGDGPLAGYTVIFDRGSAGPALTTKTDAVGHYALTVPISALTGSDTLSFMDASGALAGSAPASPGTGGTTSVTTSVAPPAPPPPIANPAPGP